MTTMTNAEWIWERHSLPRTDGVRLVPRVNGSAVSALSFYDALRSDCTARASLTNALAGCPWPAYFWETPPTTNTTLDRPFECVVLRAPGLSRVTADARPFASHFVLEQEAVAFQNLGGDAMLVAPCPSETGSHAHLAEFVRTASQAQVQEFWALLGRVVLDQLGPDPLWISTSGLGVAWLHVRLDRSPKYYQHGPYRSL